MHHHHGNHVDQDDVIDVGTVAIGHNDATAALGDGQRICCDNLPSIAMTVFASMGFILFGYHLGFSSATEYDIAEHAQLSHSQVNVLHRARLVHFSIQPSLCS